MKIVQVVTVANDVQYSTHFIPVLSCWTYITTQHYHQCMVLSATSPDVIRSFDLSLFPVEVVWKIIMHYHLNACVRFAVM